MSKRTRKQEASSLQVIVTVSGGVADVLAKPKGIAVAIYDYDVEGSDEDDPGISKDPDGQFCHVREWEPSEQVVGCHWPLAKKALHGRYSRPWKCPDCGHKIDCSYEQLAEVGTPICPDCDTDMAMQ